MTVAIISKEFSFSASHVLGGLPDEHKCRRLHGHSYRVRVEIVGALDANGFVIDYGELDWVRLLILDRLDHRHLNEVLDVNPTAENICVWLGDHVEPWLRTLDQDKRLLRLTIWASETAATWASVERAL